MESDLINFSIDLLIENNHSVQEESISILQSIEEENSSIRSLQSEVSRKTAEILAANEQLSNHQNEKASELSEIRQLYADVQAKLTSVLQENRELKETLSLVQQEKEEMRRLEEKLQTLESEKKSVCSKMEFALKQAKKWEKAMSELNEEKEGLSHELLEVREESERQNKEIIEYLEQYRDVKNLLKQEKNKVDSMAGQWRYYRNNHKHNEKLKKQLAQQIDHFLLTQADPPVDLIRDFVAMIKRRLQGDDSDDEADDEEAIDENVPQYKNAPTSGVKGRIPLSDNHN